MNKKQKEKIGDLLLDLVKYIVTAILFATWFSNISWWRWQAYIVVLASLVIITWIGVSFFEDDKTDRKRNNNYGNSSLCYIRFRYIHGSYFQTLCLV